MNGTALHTGAAAVSTDTSYAYADGIGTYANAASLDARPGGVRIVTTAEASAFGGYGIAGGVTGQAIASSNDFVITGPPGATSVTGTFYFSLHGVVELSGGYPANNGQQGGIQFAARAGSVNWLGQWISGNGSSAGGYGLGGYAGPNVGTVIGLSGDFPVGSGFFVSLELDTWNYIYGNSTYSPMLVRCSSTESPLGSTTVGIGNLNGLVMDLPAGYAVSSSEWNVVGSHFLAPVLGAPPLAAAQAGLALLSPNPSAHAMRLGFTLTEPGPVRLAIFDTSGRLVRTLADGWQVAGTQQLEWDGLDANGHTTAPGVYFASMRSPARVSTVRLVRMR